MVNRIRTLARHVWASPATAVGLSLSIIALALGATALVVDGVVEIAGGRIDRCMLRLPAAWRFSAITLGHVIVGVDHATLACVRDHERVHVRQYERWGLFFFPVYIGSSLVQLARGRHPYFDNRFEREAFAQCADRGRRPDNVAHSAASTRSVGRYDAAPRSTSERAFTNHR